MSLSSQIANAKAAQAASHPVAKRGMLALVETRLRSVYLKGGISEHVSYRAGIVSSVSRDGLAKEVRCAGGATLKREDWATCYADTRGLVADPERVVAALVDAYGAARQFATVAEAQAAIKAAASL